MSDSQLTFTLATLLGAVGVWLLLPRGTARGWAAGAVLVAIALGLGASRMLRLEDWVADGVFFILAGVTVVAAVATISFRDPVLCAIWFGLSLLGTAGLFLFAGAQFLAVATVVVYAGAILVTFLFVLMLARPKGRATWNRSSWEPVVSAATGIVMVGVLSMTISDVLALRGETGRPIVEAAETAGDRAEGVLADQHVALVGAELFGRNLVAVEVAGTLLLAALVGAAVIVARPRSEAQEPPAAD
ncbi:MAG: NADH-quinone oxidoreductase subunit J [Pirellulales bacterium]|nr:NADH-quinone oxidoreductase subunit J [Pirellulales bacterium]